MEVKSFNFAFGLMVTYLQNSKQGKLIFFLLSLEDDLFDRKKNVSSEIRDWWSLLCIPSYLFVHFDLIMTHYQNIMHLSKWSKCSIS